MRQLAHSTPWRARKPTIIMPRVNRGLCHHSPPGRCHFIKVCAGFGTSSGNRFSILSGAGDAALRLSCKLGVKRLSWAGAGSTAKENFIPANAHAACGHQQAPFLGAFSTCLFESQLRQGKRGPFGQPVLSQSQSRHTWVTTRGRAKVTDCCSFVTNDV